MTCKQKLMELHPEWDCGLIHKYIEDNCPKILDNSDRFLPWTNGIA